MGTHLLCVSTHTHTHTHTQTVFHLNPSGRFVIGGPQGDAGLTGRKIIVDTYGGWGAHGGGAFSGKDPTKVDRSACYAARWIAKSIVAGGLAKRAIVQLAYAIGVAEPLSIYVDTYGTGKYTDESTLDVCCWPKHEHSDTHSNTPTSTHTHTHTQIVKANFKLRPYDIIKELDLRRPIYFETSAMGHFGRTSETGFTWEKPRDLKIPETVVLRK